MFRFHVNKKEGNSFEIDNYTLKHLKSARVFDEQFICVFEEKFYVCRYEEGRAKIIEEIKDNHEWSGEVIIAASIMELKRFEWLIQKATELGATKLIPVYSKNVVINRKIDLSKKMERWNKIVQGAAEQSFRNKKMIIDHPIEFKDLFQKYDLSNFNKFIAFTKNQTTVKHSFPVNSIFLVGPEGGFTLEETKIAQEYGFEGISLGRRVLRAETASLFILSRINE